MNVCVLPPHQAAGRAVPSYDVTTHGDVFRPLSPMLLGPVPLYAGLWSRTMENAWQYAKVYSPHEHGGYWPWALAGWDNPRSVRYPMGKGAKPLFSQWAGDQLDYLTARRRIYVPMYAQAVRFHRLDLFLALCEQVRNPGDGIITDFDAYDHRALGYSWDDVLNDPDRKMGHGFVLAMMIEGVL
jgi:hypothetical protein